MATSGKSYRRGPQAGDQIRERVQKLLDEINSDTPRPGLFAGLGRAVMPGSIDILIQTLEVEAPQFGMRFTPLAGREMGLYHLRASELSVNKIPHQVLVESPRATLGQITHNNYVDMELARGEPGMPVRFLAFKAPPADRVLLRSCLLGLRPESQMPDDNPEASSWKDLLDERQRVRTYTQMTQDIPHINPRVQVGTLEGIDGPPWTQHSTALNDFREAVSKGGLGQVVLGPLAVLYTQEQPSCDD